MEIKILKDCYGHMFALDGTVALFEFEFREDPGSWFFWMPGRSFYPRIIPGKVFPMGYFLDACRAVNFIRKDIRLDEVVTVKGIEHTIVK